MLAKQHDQIEAPRKYRNTAHRSRSVELTAEEVKFIGGEPPASADMLLYDVSFRRSLVSIRFPFALI